MCQSFQAQRVINWGIKNLKSDCFNPIKTGGSSEIPKLHKALTYWQSQKKRKLSGQQDICLLNFPDKARESRQFLNSRQMSVKGVHARS